MVQRFRQLFFHISISFRSEILIVQVHLTVNLNTNSHEPRNPPRIVFICSAANHGLYNCNKENTIIANKDDRTKEIGVDTAAIEKYHWKY